MEVNINSIWVFDLQGKQNISNDIFMRIRIHKNALYQVTHRRIQWTSAAAKRLESM